MKNILFLKKTVIPKNLLSLFLNQSSSSWQADCDYFDTALFPEKLPIPYSNFFYDAHRVRVDGP